MVSKSFSLSGDAAEIFGQQDGFGDVLHGHAALAAFALHAAIGLLFRKLKVVLEEAFGAVDELAGFEAGTFHLGADQQADGGHETDLDRCALVREAVLDRDAMGSPR